MKTSPLAALIVAGLLSLSGPVLAGPQINTATGVVLVDGNPAPGPPYMGSMSSPTSRTRSRFKAMPNSHWSTMMQPTGLHRMPISMSSRQIRQSTNQPMAAIARTAFQSVPSSTAIPGIGRSSTANST